MKRRFERFAQVVVALCAAMTIHLMFIAVADGWPWGPPATVASSPPGRVDFRLQTERTFPPRLPGRRILSLPPSPAPIPEVSLTDPRTHGPGPLGLRAVRWSDDLGDDGKAFETAVAWLGRHQLADGGWSAHSTCREKCCPLGKGDSSQPGATAMALLVYLGDGMTHVTRLSHQDPTDEQTYCEGDTVKKALKWLIGHFTGDGKTPTSWSPQDLALASLAMVEALDLTNSAIFRDVTRKLVDTLLVSHAGGIRWKTGDGGIVEDAEATAWALMAVGIARDAGIRERGAAMREAAYAIVADGSESRLLRASMSTAARLLAPGPIKSADWPAEFRPERLGDADPAAHDLRTVHWVLLAAHQASASDPRAWKAWRDAAVTRVVDAQCNASSGCLQGSWDPPVASRLGRVGETAMNALTLLTWKRYAPALK